jgi:AraC-like DNA-binding protein
MILFCTGGHGSQLVDFEEFEIKPNTIFLMYPGQIHAWQEDHDLQGYLIFFTAAFFNMRYHNNVLLDFPFFNATARKPFIEISPEQVNHKKVLFDCMLKEYEQREEGYLKILRSYLNIVLIESNRTYESKLHTKVNSDKNAALIVNNFEQLINVHFKDKHKVKEYAELLHLTPNYLNAVCNKILNRSAGEMIRSRIMLEAKRLLLHERETVAEIGHELGFDDNSYFCRFFKKYEETSPEKFRKKYQSNNRH